ncbi:P-loop containing nucleoside triphosphate hydrolase protein [Hysterangium stoloniferum]|nr:P-loop containing nucleoside triphosphate hydrolase protein [Hysterangium stoloniferum]
MGVKTRCIGTQVHKCTVRVHECTVQVCNCAAQVHCTDCGVPYHQGYLLHGVPGSGKTSLIHSITGKLDLDVYIVSLAKKGLDDLSLNELFCNLSKHSILLIEDIDTVFQHGITACMGLSRSNSNPEDSDFETDLGGNSDSSITLSGLLNALDGIVAVEGHILFAMMNQYSALDEALRHPGQLDVHVEFKHATWWQIKKLFKSFYPPRSEKEEEELRWNNRRPRSWWKLFAFTEAESEELAEKFANAVPVDTFLLVSFQGHLMLFKERPVDAVNVEMCECTTALRGGASAPHRYASVPCGCASAVHGCGSRVHCAGA